jgi:hypothetical protein
MPFSKSKETSKQLNSNALNRMLSEQTRSSKAFFKIERTLSSNSWATNRSIIVPPLLITIPNQYENAVWITPSRTFILIVEIGAHQTFVPITLLGKTADRHVLLLHVVEGAALVLRGQQVQIITGVDVGFVACADLPRDQCGVEVRAGICVAAGDESAAS